MDLNSFYEMKTAIDLGKKTIYDFPLNYVYYTRVSTSTEEQLNSLQNQVQVFEEIAQKHPNFKLVGKYIDEGITGTSTRKRKAFNKMIEDARLGKFNIVFTKEVSRFARNTIDTLFYVDELKKLGVIVYFQSDNILSIDKDGELRLSIMATLAQEESRKMSERVKWGKKQAIENRYVTCNNRFWGYEMDGRKLKIVEEEAEMVKLIFSLYVNGLGFRRISEELTKRGYKNHNGNPFNFTSVKNIITNEKYAGFYTAKKNETTDFRTKKRVYFEKDKWIREYLPDIIPPIISIETFNDAQKILNEKSEKVKSKETSYQNSYLYSGKIKCGQHNVSYWRSLYKYDTIEDKEIWHCKQYRRLGKKGCDNPYIYKHELDVIVRHVLNELFGNKDKHIEDMINIYTNILNEQNYDEQIKELMHKTESISKKKEKLLELSLDGSISNAEFKKRNDIFNIELEVVDKQIKKYEELNESKFDSVKQLEEIKKALNEDTDFLNPELPDKVVGRYLKEVIINKGTKENDIRLKVILKPDIKVDVFYRRNVLENMHLLSSLHIDSNKRIFEFTRNSKNIDYKINIEVDAELRLIS